MLFRSREAYLLHELVLIRHMALANLSLLEIIHLLRSEERRVGKV